MTDQTMMADLLPSQGGRMEIRTGGGGEAAVARYTAAGSQTGPSIPSVTLR
jgi:hypothetical protein